MSGEITRRAVEWAHTFIPFEGELEEARFIEQAHCKWVCLLFPAGPLDRVQDICDSTLFLFATDDAFVKAPRSGGRRREARELQRLAAELVRGDAVVSDNPWLPGLADVLGRFRSRMPAHQFTRMADGLLALYSGAGREVLLREQDDLPAFDDYLRLRKDSVGAKIYFVLAEYAIGVDISSELAAVQGLDAVYEAASEHLILTNDLFSFRKEHYDGDNLNAVAVARLHSGLSLQEIVDALCEAIELREAEFIDRCNEVLASPVGGRSGVAETLRGLGHLLSGNLRWSYLTPRYHGVGYRWDGSTSGDVALHAKGTTFYGG